MVLYPDVQARAQEEIDRVVGQDRMPEWKDREHLPYIRSIVKETLRCLSTVFFICQHLILTCLTRVANSINWRTPFRIKGR